MYTDGCRYQEERQYSVISIQLSPKERKGSFQEEKQFSVISFQLSVFSYRQTALSNQLAIPYPTNQPINYLTASLNELNELHEPYELNELSVEWE